MLHKKLFDMGGTVCVSDMARFYALVQLSVTVLLKAEDLRMKLPATHVANHMAKLLLQTCLTTSFSFVSSPLEHL